MAFDVNSKRIGSVREIGLLFGLVLVLVTAGCDAQSPDGYGGAGGFGGSGGRGGETGLVTDEPSKQLADMDEQMLAATPQIAATACTSGPQCPTGYCVDGFCCDQKCDNKCMACSAAKKGSGADGICGSIKYDTDPDNDCPSGACDGKNQCKNYNSVSCTSAAQCLSNYCVDGVCCNNICMGSCQACSAAKKGSGQDGICGSIKAATDPDNECSNGDCNGSGACTTNPQPTFPNGTACSSSTQCASGYCADGVCCDSWCLGTCQACTAVKKNQGTDGTCGPIANDKDPDDECWGGACNGAGVCKQYNGVPCTDKTQCLSNFCVDGFCCGNICTGWCYACSEARKGGGYDGVCGPILSGRDPDNECSPGECNGTGTCNQTQTPLANGAACVASAQCASGNCVDGVCCDTACTGSCQACSATKKGQGTNGTCGNIKYDTDPDEECHGGACSGIGMCQYYNSVPCTAATQCLSAYCVDGVCCGNQCTGTCYACTTAKKGSGSDGVCGVIANNTDPDNECGFTCNGAGACSRAPNGSTCTTAAECTSGFCVDGVCCNNSCQGSCMMCNTAAAMGTCTAACPPPCSGTIGLPAPPVGPPLMNESVYIGSPADLNNDGLIDLIYRPAWGSGVSIKLNQGGGTFGPASTYATNYSLLQAAVGDVNGDGFADLVMPPSTTSASSGTLIVLLNQTNGTFGAPITLASATGVISAVVVDVNGDGTNDIATVCPNTISVFLNQGGGTFAPRVDYANANSYSPLRAGDFNGDGRTDLVFRMNSGGGFSIMYNHGNGTFAAPTSYPIGVGPDAMVLGDVNADGKLDLALTNPFSGLSVVINQGNGAFAPRVEYAAGASPDSISMADFNADGKIDIAVLNDVAVGVFLNLGNGTFGPRKEWSTNGQPSNFQVGDVDGDGDIDFVCGNLGEARIVSNLGNAVFGPTYTEYPLSGVVELGDLNGDGKLDLVVGKNDQVLVRFNQGNGLMGAATSYTVGTIRDVIAPDLNGDGKADVVAATVDAIKVLMNNGNGLLAFTGSYATTGSYNRVIAADFTGDGKPDLAVASHNAGDSGPGPSGPRSSSNVLRVYANQGNGALVLLNEFGGGGVYDLGSSCTVAAADLNGDARVDMAFSSPDGNTTRILLNQGNATFVEGTALTQSSSNMLAADLNGDGKVDLLMSGVLLNQGNATFVEQGPLSVPWTALLADMNGDSRPDLIGRQIFEHTLSLALNQGNGTFPSYATYPSGGTQPEFLVAGDVDNDDIPEIVVGNTASDTVTILKRNCFP